MPTTSSGGDAGLGEQPRHRDLQALEVVTRILQGPVGLELDVVVGGRKARVDDAVRVRFDARPELAPVRAVDEDGARRLGAEVDPERALHGWTTTFRPRRSTRSRKARGPSSSRYRALTSEASSSPPGLRQGDRARKVARAHAPAEDERQLLAACRRGVEAGAVAVGDADEHDAAAGARRRDRGVERPVIARRLVGDVDLHLRRARSGALRARARPPHGAAADRSRASTATPAACSACTSSRPIGPQPKTAAVVPGPRRRGRPRAARRRAARAAGRPRRRRSQGADARACSGQATSVRSPPSVEP